MYTTAWITRSLGRQVQARQPPCNRGTGTGLWRHWSAVSVASHFMSADMAFQHDHRYTAKVELKKGMRVVLLQNLDLEQGLVNGSQGVVLRFEESAPASMPIAFQNKPPERTDNVFVGTNARFREHMVRRFIKRREYEAWPVVQFGHGASKVTRTIYADCSVTPHDADATSLLSRTQLPLAPGYAITIHKAQVMATEHSPCELRD
jgi:ATP-dependent DNA helicase PIF1